MAIDSVPHDWLFPQMAAVVHHGGMGTTAAGFRAGVPTIGVPFFGDQYYWTRRAYELGIGTKPIARGRLSAENLAQAIQKATTDSWMRDDAAHIGKRIRAENGVANAVAVAKQIFR